MCLAARVRALGRGRVAGDRGPRRACTCSACATSTPARRARSRPPALSAEIPDGVPLYVHLDTDVLDPSVMAAQFPVPDGWDARRLRAQLAELAAGCRIVGVEITALEDLARRRAGRRGDRSRCWTDLSGGRRVGAIAPCPGASHPSCSVAALAGCGGGEERAPAASADPRRSSRRSTPACDRTRTAAREGPRFPFRDFDPSNPDGAAARGRALLPEARQRGDRHGAHRGPARARPAGVASRRPTREMLGSLEALVAAMREQTRAAVAGARARMIEATDRRGRRLRHARA